MIEYLIDTASGEIDEFPHILKGDLKVAFSSGDINFFSSSLIMTNAEIVKYDDKYIYIRTSGNSSTVYLCEPNGYCGKSMLASELGLRY